jgi:hypothetical protein
MLFQEQFSHPVQRRLGRGYLIQDVIAIHASLDHPFDTAHLPLDPVHPVHELPDGLLAMMALTRLALLILTTIGASGL